MPRRPRPRVSRRPYRQAVAVKRPVKAGQLAPPRAAFTPSGIDEPRDMLNQFMRDIERGTLRDQARLLGRSVVRREHHRNTKASPRHTTPLTCTITPAGQDANGSLVAHR